MGTLQLFEKLHFQCEVRCKRADVNRAHARRSLLSKAENEEELDMQSTSLLPNCRCVRQLDSEAKHRQSDLFLVPNM
ncbi:hypothetical protein Y032_0016g3141 [Ancylostoma ceylanicum]|uniref:Uncharacterized protein n=1 Tax=Ancylostoma ceylanicum TaxID=53326 RepID=A0A016V805_9BILA|nr:hypothetical protein Y032_0016g3141 [Ancylostoma ceylanicum]